MDAFVGGEMVWAGFRFHWFGKDHIAVVVIDDENVSVAGAGW